LAFTAAAGYALLSIAGCGARDQMALPRATSVSQHPPSPPPASAVAVATPIITAPLRVRDPSWSFTLKHYRKASLETAALPRSASPPSGSITGPHHSLTGLASFYWQGQHTASGEPFDRRSFTAAHRTLPFNTRVKVTELRSGKFVIVRINDRGPFKPGRIIDVSEAAAEVLGMQSSGLTPVKLEVVGN
jgi:rare lipoprotein A